MVSLRTMLYPTDFSACSKAVASYADELHRLGVERVDILHVVNLTRLEGAAGGFDINTYIDSETKRVREEAPKLAEEFEKAGIEVRVLDPPAGDPVAEIVRVAESYDFVGMSSHGHGIIRELLLGSTSEGVVRKSKVPVLLFKFKLAEERCLKLCDRMFERILVAYDFSKYADAALEYAIYAAKRLESELHVVYVVEDDRSLGEIEDKLAGVSYKLHERKGVPHKEILALREEIDASIVFVGFRGVNPITAFLLGSVSDFIIRRCPTPVFVAKVVE